MPANCGAMVANDSYWPPTTGSAEHVSLAIQMVKHAMLIVTQQFTKRLGWTRIARGGCRDSHTAGDYFQGAAREANRERKRGP